MRCNVLSLVSLISLLVASSALAQPRPPGDGGGPPPHDGAGRDGGGGREGGPREGRGPGGGMRDGMGGGMRPPGMGDGPMGQIQMLRGYLEVVDSFSRMAKDPTNAGIAAVVSANDILKPRGPEAIANYFNQLLPKVKNEAVQRAIRIQLANAYKESGQQDKALEQMESLITGAGGGGEAR